MSFLRVKNWGRFQHYKHRNPPWIKLYRDSLYDPELRALSDTVRLLYYLLLQLAARRNDGLIPYKIGWISEETGLPERSCKRGISALLAVSFLSEEASVPASNSASKPASKFASNGDSPDSTDPRARDAHRRELEGEKELKPCVSESESVNGRSAREPDSAPASAPDSMKTADDLAAMQAAVGRTM